MSQRNPMNDRYQSDDHKGQTRRSAASAKPKSKAASSVRVQTPTKTPQQKKATQKAERQKQKQVEAKYYNPPTAEYKKWRKIWWILLISAIVLTASSFLVRMIDPGLEVFSLVILGLAYVGIIGALVTEFVKIRKIRQAYQVEMQGKVSKEERALEKQEKAATAAAKKAAEEAAKAKAEEKDATDSPIERRKGLFSFSGLRGAAQRASQNNKAAAQETGSASGQTDSVDSETKGK